ncbi:MAG: hypothetical protein AB1531_06590 [Chloroflexota bacterium]
MTNTRPLLKACLAALSVLLPAVIASACLSTQPAAGSTPVVHTLEVTQLVTRVVTLEVTREVAVPVTVTPTATLEFTYTPTLTPTITSTAAITLTPELPQITILEYIECLYGPADFYLYKTNLLAGSVVEVVGRDKDAFWLNVQEVHGWNSCWIPVEAADMHGLSVSDLPVVTTMLPLTRYEYGPPAGYARRDGDEVTVYWNAVWISLDEVRGYLIEANTCQGGEFIQQMIFFSTTFEENVGTLSYKFRDEAGCEQASGVRIASVGKRGYTLFEKVIWPPR